MLKVGTKFGDRDCRAHCCPKHTVDSYVPAANAAVHVWDAETTPHPYTVTPEVFGGAVINSHSITQGPAAEYFDPAGDGQMVKLGSYSLQLELDITAPAGRWNAWVILWMPSSNVAVEEILDATDPTAGIVTLQNITSGLIARQARISVDIVDAPYTVFGLAVKYDSVTYYTPHAVLTDSILDQDGTQVDIAPHCWRSLLNVNTGETIDAGTLDYSGTPLSFDCKPSPAGLTEVGMVLGLTTVAADPADDLNVSGDLNVTLNIDNPYAVANYGPDCACWYAATTLTTLDLTFSVAPSEIVGQTLTLTLQGDGTFTGSGTYPDMSDPLIIHSYNVVYDPVVAVRHLGACSSLLLHFLDCGGIPTNEYAMLIKSHPFAFNDPSDPDYVFKHVENGYLAGSTWSPISIIYSWQHLVNLVPGNNANFFIPCALTPNTTHTTNGPTEPGYLFELLLEE